MFSILKDEVPESETDPKMAKLIKRGPIVVPTLFTPPAKLNRWEPFLGSPIVIASGLAAVCCKEKPSATINKPEIIKGKETLSGAATGSDQGSRNFG